MIGRRPRHPSGAAVLRAPDAGRTEAPAERPHRPGSAAAAASPGSGASTVYCGEPGAHAPDRRHFRYPRTLRPEIDACLSGVSPIIHAEIGGWPNEYPYTQNLTLAGRLIHVLHHLNELQLDPARCGIDVVTSRHSHRCRVEIVESVLYLNQGSAGPRRFKLPVTIAPLDLRGTA